MNTSKKEAEMLQKQLQDKKLGNCINLTVELETAFRLYSYHTITPLQFIERVGKNLELYTEINKRCQEQEQQSEA